MTTVRAIRGDLTDQAVDAIVNAANIHLQHGGGVAGALASRGGPIIQRESDDWVRRHGPLTPGTAAVTDAGELPARFVVHVAGPIYDDTSDANADLLAAAVVAALDAATNAGARTIAMPAISAGIYGYPRSAACEVIARTTSQWVQAHPDELDEIVLVGFDDATAADFAAALDHD